MTKEELINKINILPNNAEIKILISGNYAEIENISFEYSQRINERKPFIIINAMEV